MKTTLWKIGNRSIICRLQTAGLDDNGENLIDWRSCKHLIDVYVDAEIAHGRAITRSAAMWIGLDETARRYIRVIIDFWLTQRKGDAIIAERKRERQRERALAHMAAKKAT